MPDEKAANLDVIHRPVKLNWLRPPTNVNDAAAWDRYWQDQVDHRVSSFHDMFLRDERLVRFMTALESQSVLCAGNGLSIEPYVLAYAGFQVTAVDLSVWATQLQQNWQPRSKSLKNHLYGRISSRIIIRRSFSNTVRQLGWLLSDVKKHILNPVKRKGGTLKFLAGDLLDPEFCEGPFDTVIERRTVQLYSGAERDRILERLTTRLAPQGIFVSHCHMGWWRPGQPRTHPCEQWFHEHGFKVNPSLHYSQFTKNPERIAVLTISTG